MCHPWSRYELTIFTAFAYYGIGIEYPRLFGASHDRSIRRRLETLQRTGGSCVTTVSYGRSAAVNLANGACMCITQFAVGFRR